MFVLPTECSSCGSQLHYDGVNLWCRNSECPAQSIGITSNFFKVMDIKGFGPSTCEKLGTVKDILTMTKEQFISAIGQGNGSKLFDLVTQAKSTQHDGAKVLTALSIPSVGPATAAKLALLIQEGQLVVNEDSLILAGITPASRLKIINWFKTDYESVWGGVLPLSVRSNSVQASRSNEGPTVCITGKIDGYTRDSLASYLSDKYGCKVVSTVSNKLDYLICNIQSKSSSFTKAQSLGIPILTLNQFEEKLND